MCAVHCIYYNIYILFFVSSLSHFHVSPLDFRACIAFTQKTRLFWIFPFASIPHIFLTPYFYNHFSSAVSSVRIMQIASCSKYLNYSVSLVSLSRIFHLSISQRSQRRQKPSVILNIYRTLYHSSSSRTIRFQEVLKYRLFVIYILLYIHSVSYSSHIIYTSSVSRNSGLHGVVWHPTCLPLVLPLLVLRPSSPSGSPRAHGTRYRGGSARAQTRVFPTPSSPSPSPSRNRLHRNAQRSSAAHSCVDRERGTSRILSSLSLRGKTHAASARYPRVSHPRFGVPRVCPGGGVDEDRGWNNHAPRLGRSRHQTREIYSVSSR